MANRLGRSHAVMVGLISRPRWGRMRAECDTQLLFRIAFLIA